jgi:hypothetical protein
MIFSTVNNDLSSYFKSLKSKDKLLHEEEKGGIVIK